MHIALAWSYGFSCPRYFPYFPGDFGGSFNISYHFNYCSANPGVMLHPEFGMRSIHHDLCPKTDFLIPYFRWRKKGAISAFGILTNHLASLFFLPLSGDLLGLLYVSVPHSLPIRSQSTNICWFPFWPGFVTWGIDLNSSFNGQSLAC